MPILAWMALAGMPSSALAEPIDLADIVRNPLIGNYKGYAEFKMAHYANARAIWEALSARGNPEAHFNLGILDEDGLGGAVDMASARRHYEQAAAGGSSKAQYRLGLLLTTGGKLARDAVLAARYLGDAAAQGDRDAAALLAASDGRSQVERDFVVAETLRATGRDAAAVAIWRRLADGGHPRAAARLAWMLESGTGVQRNLPDAAAWFRRAAQLGDAEAQFALSVMLRTGQGQPRDPVEAERWLRLAAAQGHQAAGAALRH